MEEEKPLLDAAAREKGGYRTLPSIVGNEAFEKMATFGSSPNMVLYLTNEYHLSMTAASNIIFLWSSATNFTPLIGAILADSSLGQLRTIGFGSIICLTGLICQWLTAVIPQAKPSHSKATFLQLMFLCLALGLISVGAGGIRSCSLAFGANQIERSGSPTAKRSYFGWYYGIYTFSILIGLTCVVYVKEKMGWGVGFAVPVVLMMLGVVSFHLASPFYVKSKGEASLVAGFLRVIVASYKNRGIEIPGNDGDDVAYHSGIGSDVASPSSSLGFLNKACVVRDPENELTPHGTASHPWRLCTVDQVEDLKSLLRVIPIWSSGTIMTVNLCQTSVAVLQASSMDRHVSSRFEIPAASFGMFAVVSVITWISLYEGLIVPLASRVLKKPFRVGPTKRMGFGIFLSFLSMTVSALVERARRRSSAADDGAHAMSAMWLIPQHCLLGFAEASSDVAQNEFFFSELPRRMWSLSTSMFWAGAAAANLIASLLMNVVDGVSGIGGRESWVSSDVDKGRYDLYYSVLAGLSLVNFVYFLACSRAYGPLKEERDVDVPRE